MNKNIFALLLISTLAACGDHDNDAHNTVFISPAQGDNFNAGTQINVKLDISSKQKIESISYLVDDSLISTRHNSDSILLDTKNLPLGYRMITAIIKHDRQVDTITTNVVLKTSKAPIQLKYKVVNTFPHNTDAYTEGLSFVDGRLLESTGEKGASELKYVDLNSGKDLQKTTLESKYFGEGSLKIGNKIIMLTWQENIGFIFDVKTLKQIGTFPYQNSKEGWGLTFDGKNILRSDGTNRIWRMNAETFKEESYLEVYDNKGPVSSLNELEYINGRVYANVYLSNKIVVINPLSGAVEAEIGLSALVPKNYYKTTEEEQNNVLNGIAWDEQNKRMFVGGKKWPKLYEIKLIP